MRLEQIVGYQLGGPCVQRGEEGTVLDVAERVSLGVTRLNEKCNSRGEQRDQLRALIAECVVALLAVVPYVDEALRARFTEDVAALVARAQRSGISLTAQSSNPIPSCGVRVEPAHPGRGGGPREDP